MIGETKMYLAVAGRKRQTVQTARHLAECYRNDNDLLFHDILF